MNPLCQPLNDALRKKGIKITTTSQMPDRYVLTDDGRDETIHKIVSQAQRDQEFTAVLVVAK